ncbi:hypothetical protein BC835DRAFT_1445206 [Cytidiella melzeri]|nr:hypothetical protein BC835DRAFT_1445206 [Cytidiella melzeri]
MTAIVSPQPRRGSLNPPPAFERPALLLSPPIYPSNDSSRLSKPSAPCSSTKRRRTTAATTRTLRRRHCTRPDTSLALQSSVFDQLPWISQVELPPKRIDVWDIADLSLLPDDLHPDAGVGPVRRRKTSLRSSHSEPAAHHHPSLAPLPFPQAVLARMEQDPHTPPPTVRLNPMEVTFRNLMPVFSSDGEEFAASPRIPAWSRPSSPTPM